MKGTPLYGCVLPFFVDSFYILYTRRLLACPPTQVVRSALYMYTAVPSRTRCMDTLIYPYDTKKSYPEKKFHPDKTLNPYRGELFHNKALTVFIVCSTCVLETCSKKNTCNGVARAHGVKGSVKLNSSEGEPSEVNIPSYSTCSQFCF